MGMGSSGGFKSNNPSTPIEDISSKGMGSYGGGVYDYLGIEPKEKDYH